MAALAGLPPLILWRLFGNPVDLLPSAGGLGDWLAAPTGLSGSHLGPTLVWLGWLAWTILLVLLTGSLIAVVAGRRPRRWRLPAPLHRLVFGLAGTAVITLVNTPHANAAAPAPVTAAAPSPGNTELAPETAAAVGPVTVLVGDTTYEYVVRRGDTLSKIARRWLDDADRWPEICDLNRHRHVADNGRTLTDCDLIFPGWQLRLPADATPPQGTKPAPRVPPASPQPDRRQPEAAASATPPPPAPSPPSTPAPTPPASPPAAADEPAPRGGITADDGLTLPDGSFLPWTLTGAVSATAALVWLHRRRRYQPGTADPIPALPAAVTAIRRGHRQHHTTGNRQTAAPAPTPTPTPAGGLGLTGDGAHAAARAALITALTTARPGEAAHPARVVIDRPTLTTLFGAHTDTISGWPRLAITDDLPHALTELDTHLLHRARLLDEHDHASTGGDTPQPGDGSLPSLLLLTTADTAATTTRARITLGLTDGVDTMALLLGDWTHGTTVAVGTDGHTRHGEGTPTTTGRLAVLDRDTAADILHTTREAHTGEPSTPAVTEIRPAPPVEEPDDTTAATPPAAGDGLPGIAHLHVLGAPTVPGTVLPGRPLRSKAAELAVYLACHPDGADTDTIADQLLPDARMRQAKQQVHTNASNLRHVLGRAGGPKPGNGYLLKRGPSARYRLDPTTVQVDLWQMRDLLSRARLTSPPTRTDLLRQACKLYTAELANGCDYDWIEPHREKARRWAIDAHTLLAADLLAGEPGEAAAVMDKAIGIDPYNEELYRQAMRTRHALQDSDGIRVLLQALTTALHDLDAEPDATTVDLACRLGASLRT